MSKQITLHNTKDIEKEIENLRLSAEKSQLKLNDICGYSDPLELLKIFKFEKIGHDPLNNQRPLNFIEQLNQTFTYLASFKAASILFEMHPGLTSMTLNLGTRAGSDIESDFDGGIAAEVFAAVNPKSNNKLKKDIQKVSSVNVKHKYVFFMCPNIKKGHHQDL